MDKPKREEYSCLADYKAAMARYSYATGEGIPNKEEDE